MEKDEAPCAQNRAGEGEERAAPERRFRHEQQCQQNAQLRGGDGRARGRGDELVRAQLLHDETGNAHAHAGAQHRKQAGQPGDEQNAQLLRMTGEQSVWVEVDHAHEERGRREQHKPGEQNQGRQTVSDGNPSLWLDKPNNWTKNSGRLLSWTYACGLLTADDDSAVEKAGNARRKRCPPVDEM